MKIGVDTRELKKDKAGKGWYVFNVLKEILNIDQENEFILYGDIDTQFLKAPNAKQIIVQGSSISWHYKVARRLKKDGVDLYWAPTSPIVPAITSISTIMTIHDLTTLLFPDKHLLKSRIIDKLFLKKALSKTKTILADSEATKSDLERLFPFSENKITVSCLGYDKAFKKLPDSEVENKISKYNLKPGYILFVGTLEPRKNVEGIIESYARINSKMQDDHHLVLVGKKGWYYNSILEKIEQSGIKNNIKVLDYVPFDDLPALYNGAGIFLYPSFYEGFGLPPLEALACGTPVIASNVSSLPEVIGDAGILVDPNNHDQIAHAIEKVLSDEKTRINMQRSSLGQAARFSWSECAKETARMMQEAIK